MPEFTRFAETITKKQDKRVVNITVKPTVTDCTGTCLLYTSPSPRDTR